MQFDVYVDGRESKFVFPLLIGKQRKNPLILLCIPIKIDCGNTEMIILTQ